MGSMDSRTLFDRVLALCSFSDLLGPGTVRRALNDAGVNIARATVEDYERALPRLAARLRAYVPAEDANQRVRRVAVFLRAEKAARVNHGERSS